MELLRAAEREPRHPIAWSARAGPDRIVSRVIVFRDGRIIDPDQVPSFRGLSLADTGRARVILLSLRMALREIRRNTLRSFLTMLGIVIASAR